MVTGVFVKIAWNGFRIAYWPAGSAASGTCHAVPVIGLKEALVVMTMRSIRAPSSRIHRSIVLVPALVTFSVATVVAVTRFVQTHAL